MADAGYPQWEPAPDLPELGGSTLTDWRYGVGGQFRYMTGMATDSWRSATPALSKSNQTANLSAGALVRLQRSTPANPRRA